MEAGAPDVREFCLRILTRGDLASKLAPPPLRAGEALADAAPGSAVRVAAPARVAALAMTGGAGALPHPRELSARGARATCLARFAHHELMAVELFAWALLRWPELPAAMRRGWLATLADEQRHCGMYLERLRALGSDLPEHARSDYFWRHVPAIERSPHGPRAFLAAMGLTLEQANLDFTLLYRDAFRAVGDDATAGVCQAVHDDEVGHVRQAATWLARLADPRAGEIQRYEEAVPFPLSAARAKGRRFQAAPRRSAGLGEDFIAHVRAARSSQERRPGRPAVDR